MAHQIRVTIESLNDAGEVISKDIVMTKNVTKPNHSRKCNINSDFVGISVLCDRSNLLPDCHCVKTISHYF